MSERKYDGSLPADNTEKKPAIFMTPNEKGASTNLQNLQLLLGTCMLWFEHTLKTAAIAESIFITMEAPSGCKYFWAIPFSWDFS